MVEMTRRCIVRRECADAPETIAAASETRGGSPAQTGQEAGAAPHVHDWRAENAAGDRAPVGRR